MTGPDTRLPRDHYEALVIGTGFGGAVAACRLAQAGIDVAVVERGRRWPPGSFPRGVSDLQDGWLWARGQGLYDPKPLSDILAVCAAGYGGGSLVYANVAMRPPAEVFDDQWPRSYSRQALEPYFDLVAHMLAVRPITTDPRTGKLPPKTGLMQEAARQRGKSSGFFQPNLAVTFGDPDVPVANAFGVPQSGCRFCGECDIGCNYTAKNTLDYNYLAVAEQFGADVGTLTEAVHISRAGDAGYRVRLRESTLDGERCERDVTARSVFVCAGAIGSTELLLRCRDQYRTLPDLPSALGHGFSGNGDFLSFGRGTRARFEPSSGPTITTATVLQAQGVDRPQWFLVQDGGYSKHLASLVRGLDLGHLPSVIARAVRRRPRSPAAGRDGDDHVAVLLAMGRDRADGRIELRGRGHRLRVRWDVPRNDPLYAAERVASAHAVRTLGGRPFSTPNWRLLRQPVTVHNIGGCRMSDDPADGVTDPEGQVHGHPGLYVTDGATLPGATGANPSMTIAAVAERCAEAAVRRMRGNADWVAPERADAVHHEPPEDAAVRAVLALAAAPLPATAGGVRFRERMRGRVAVPAPAGGSRSGAVEMRLVATIEDVRLFLADPAHRVTLTGAIRVDGVTAVPVPVTRGELRLLVPHDAGRGRSMDYSVGFTGDDGRRWRLQGSKDVSWHRRHGPWRATTVLHAGLSAADDPERASPTGTLSISPSDVVRLLLSIRGLPSRAVPAGGGLPPAVRFVAFFVGAARRALLPRRTRDR